MLFRSRNILPSLRHLHLYAQGLVFRDESPRLDELLTTLRHLSSLQTLRLGCDWQDDSTIDASNFAVVALPQLCYLHISGDMCKFGYFMAAVHIPSVTQIVVAETSRIGSLLDMGIVTDLWRLLKARRRCGQFTISISFFHM